MVQDHLDALRAMYAAWAHGDFRAGHDLLHPDFQLETVDGPTEPGPLNGRERMAEWMREYLSLFEDLRIRADAIEPAGDAVLVSVTTTGVQRASGFSLDLRYFAVWRFHGGLAASCRNVRDVLDARRLAGLGDTDVDIVRSVYQAWERGETWAVLHVVKPDVVWYDGIPLQPATYRGPEGIRKQIRDYVDPLEGVGVRCEGVRRASDRILGLVRIAGRGRTSGLDTEVALGHLWRLHEGLATEVRLLERSQALEEAGESP